MNRRDFVRKILAASGMLWIGSDKFSMTALADLSGFRQTTSQNPKPQFNDLAEFEEARHPLLAGDFQEALKILVPRLKDRPGAAPYVVATIYLRLEQYQEGIPFALQACRDTPTDIRYRWMLNVLTILAGKPEESIPKEFRLSMPESAPSMFRFRDVTDQAGVGRFALGRGVAWGDFDNDGRDDILVGAERAPFRLLRNLGNGKFEDCARRLGLVDPVGLGCYASQFIDYDNDGYEDIFLSSNGWGGGGRLFLFHNDRGQRFSEISESAGLGGSVNGFGSSWADYDDDGFPDLAVAAGVVDPPEGDRLRLFHNERNGKFREMGREAGLTQKARWISVCWGDYDGDGRQDLLATSFDAGCFLFRNMGNGRFEDVSVEAGLRNSHHTYTAQFFDYNNDGRLDLFVSTYPDGDLQTMIGRKISGAAVPANQRQLLFFNNGDGTFTDVTQRSGITGWYGAMSSQVADVDNDGYPEIVLGTGNPALDWAEPKPLFRSGGTGRFLDIAGSAGLIHYGMLHGIAFSDYDDSGNLSMCGSFGGFYWGSRETSRLYRNLGCRNKALEVRLVGVHSNRDAIGARVTAFVNNRRILNWVNGGNGFGALNSRTVHIGVAGDSMVDLLQLDWPSGHHQTFRNVPAGQRIEIVEGRNSVRTLVRFAT